MRPEIFVLKILMLIVTASGIYTVVTVCRLETVYAETLQRKDFTSFGQPTRLITCAVSQYSDDS